MLRRSGWDNLLADAEGWHYYDDGPDDENGEDGIDTDGVYAKSDSATHAPTNRWRCADNRVVDSFWSSPFPCMHTV